MVMTMIIMLSTAVVSALLPLLLLLPVPVTSLATTTTAPSKHYIGIDLGTSGCRISVVQQPGRTEVYTRAVPWKEGAYDDPTGWVEAVRSLIRAASTDVPELDTTLDAVCVSGTSASCVIMDAQTGEALHDRARMYDHGVSDGDVLDRLKAAAPSKHTAAGPTGSLAKLLEWHNDGEGLDPSRHVLAHQADFVVAHLCHNDDGDDDGEYTVVSDWHNCLKLGYDVQRLEWPTWLTALLHDEGMDATRILPSRVVSPGQVIGTVSASVATALGISSDTRVVGGTTDSNAAFFAAVQGTPTRGTAVTSLGSTTALKLLSSAYVEDATYGVYSHRFPQTLLKEDDSKDGANDEAWLVGGASNAGCAVFRQLGFSNDELAELSAHIDPDTRSPLEYYPLVRTGERFPVADPNKLPVLEPVPDSRQDYLHGLLESLTRVEVDGYARLAALGAPWPTCVWTCGGGAQNPTWTTMRQSRLRRSRRGEGDEIPVTIAPHVEASYGAALLAMQAAEQEDCEG